MTEHYKFIGNHWEFDHQRASQGVVVMYGGDEEVSAHDPDIAYALEDSINQGHPVATYTPEAGLLIRFGGKLPEGTTRRCFTLYQSKDTNGPLKDPPIEGVLA